MSATQAVHVLLQVLEEIARRLTGAAPGTPVIIHTYRETIRDISTPGLLRSYCPLDLLRDLLEALSREATHVAVIQAVMRRELISISRGIGG